MPGTAISWSMSAAIGNVLGDGFPDVLRQRGGREKCLGFQEAFIIAEFTSRHENGSALKPSACMQRRSVLGVLAGSGAAFLCGPMPLHASSRDGLYDLALTVAEDPGVFSLGQAAAAGRSAFQIEAELRDRVRGCYDVAGWQEALLHAARVDLSEGLWVSVGDRCLLQSEALFLGLAARLKA